MGRYSAGVLTSAGSTLLPLMSLYGIVGVGAKLREVGMSSSTAVKVELKLVRLTTAATPGAGLTAGKHDPDGPAASCTPFTTHSSAGPGVGDDLGYRTALGPAIGTGVIWTFGDTGLIISPGTANGIGVIVEVGAGTPMQMYFVWDE